MERTIDELRLRLQAIQTGQTNLSTERREIERALLRATATVWIGEINRDDEGNYDGYLHPVSPEVADGRFSLDGNEVTMAFSRGHDRDSLWLRIDGEEQANFCVDGSGHSRYRAFRDRAEAVRWVEQRAKIQNA